MTGSYAASPTSAAVVGHIRALRKRHPGLVKVRKLGVTAEGRPIHAVVITDPAAPKRDKQHVLIAAGHHGNEESGRLIALALVDWLVRPPAREVREKQKIAILPNMNPDLAERDVYDPPGGVTRFRDHGLKGPRTPEGRALEKVANELEPELYVDMHARGFAGCSYDMVLWAEPETYTEDDHLLHGIAAEMAEAGERAGIPNVTHPLSWPGFMSERPDVSSAVAFAYRNFKSLSILTETCESNEHAYPPRDRARSGLARMKALLAWGSRRHPKLYYPGYPCYLVGMFQRGLVAVGKTAAGRRKSRVEIWRHWSGFKRFDVAGPEAPTEKRMVIEYKGPPLTHGVGLQTSVRGARDIVLAAINGRRLRWSETDGYYAWRYRATTFVVVAMPALRAGRYELVIEHARAAGG